MPGNHSIVDSYITPISDGVVLSKELISDFENHYVSVTFYSDAVGRVVISKSAMTGSVLLEATVNGVEYGVMLVDTDTNGMLPLGVAGELVGQVAGSYKYCRATLNITGAAGATHVKLSVNNYKG